MLIHFAKCDIIKVEVKMSSVQDLMDFNNICDEFVLGKYILADLKISALLKAIASSEKIKDIVSSCMNNYNFNTEYAKHVAENDDGTCSLTLPSDEQGRIAFIFCLLYRFDTKTINFYEFLNKFYFKEDTPAGQEFITFSNEIISPFKAAINNMYSNRHIIKDSADFQNNYYNKLISAINVIAKRIDTYRLKTNEKEEFVMLLNSLYTASEQNNKKLVYSLMIALDYFTKFNKHARNAYLMLEDCFS